MPYAPKTIYKVGQDYYTGLNQKVNDTSILASLEAGNTPYSTVQKGLEGQFTDPQFFGKTQKGEPSILSSSAGRNAFEKNIVPKIQQANEQVNQIVQKPKRLDPYYDGGWDEYMNSKDSALTTESILASENETPEDKINKQIFQNYENQRKSAEKIFDTLSVLQNNNAQIQRNSLTNSYNERKGELEKANQRFMRDAQTSMIRTGVARYAPQSANNFLSEKEQEHIKTLSDLDNQYNTKLGEINSAMEAKSISLAAQLTQDLNQIDEKVLKVLQEQVKEAATVNREIRDFNFKVQVEEAKVQKDINEVLKQAKINGADPTTIEKIAHSGSVTEAILNAGDFVGDNMERAYKQAQIENLKVETKKKLQDMVIDSPGYKTAKAQSEILDILSLTDSILESPYLGQVFGFKNPFTYWTPGSNEQYVKNQVEQLKGFLALENRQKLKGSGAISDFESRTLERAASSLSKNLSDVAAERELRTIRGIMSTANGLTTLVKITDPVSGRSKILEADRNGINQAIIDGLTVEYQ